MSELGDGAGFTLCVPPVYEVDVRNALVGACAVNTCYSTGRLPRECPEGAVLYLLPFLNTTTILRR